MNTKRKRNRHHLYAEISLERESAKTNEIFVFEENLFSSRASVDEQRKKERNEIVCQNRKPSFEKN